MIYLVAIFIAAAGALIGWQLGLAVFIAVFEALRWLDLEALLDSPAALTAFRYAHIAAAIAAGLWLLHRWWPRGDQPTSNGKVVLIATVAALGAALLATPVVILTIGRTAQSLEPIFAALAAAVIGGAAFTANVYGQPTSRAVTAARGALASVLAVAVIWLGYIFDVETSGFAARLGPPHTVLIDIRVPHQRPEFATIRIAMRSEGRDFPGQPQFWLTEGDGGILRASVPLVAGTRDRTVVLVLPDEPERLLRIDLPVRPRRTQYFGDWLRFEPAGDPAREARYYLAR